VLSALKSKPEILWMTPKTIAEIHQNIRDLGKATNRVDEAERLISEGQAKLQQISEITRGQSSAPRVFCMEWLEPVYCSGHWVPEMVEIAGGIDSLGQKGGESVRITWEAVLEWSPEILFIMPCGLNLDEVVAQTAQLANYPGWFELPAVRNNRVFAMDANSYFARPGPRVVEGTELLAHLIHPEVFSWRGPTDAYQRIEFAENLPLVEGRDFYWEGPAMVFTSGYLLRRGYCCESGCRHCPYSPDKP
jgi:iron complex transport system substrate-binding protein